MTALTNKITEAGFVDHILTDIDLNNLLGSTPAARYGMVNKALKKAELIKIRRGLYLLTDKYRHKKLSKFFLASRIAPHSYISFESALSYHGWIPERVATVTSGFNCSRTKKFTTLFGEFVFYPLPVNEYHFLTGVNRIEAIPGEPFLLASPLRALTDLVYVRKIDWQGLGFLTDGLRIETEQLLQIKPEHFSEMKKVFHATRVLDFLNNLENEIKKL